MGGSSFDLIAQELLKQRNIMEELEAENRRLREQLTDLRAGYGVFLEINGTRIALDTLQAVSSSSPEHMTVTQAPQASTVSMEPQEQESQESVEEEVAQPVAQQPGSTSPLQQAEKKETEQPTFLEEIMLDEFASALTSPHAALPAPEKQSSQPSEEQKAHLRRELMGSFLLE
ncbi:hypothetical protein [Dictyobacter kobayashii]|uniref:Uncharacterized protein n=1 Tax=Dictyobacter kobayashii TaxID=2014872 RepID=A0A402ADJ4_9CHLR|nr:hypothetical protein [Dictyobacter kobayashii]GCE17180.1 hypothetical protein KDK_09800 [Dictyobacter kobayashii]